VVNDHFFNSVFFVALLTVYSYLKTQRIDFDFLLCCTCMMYDAYDDLCFHFLTFLICCWLIFDLYGMCECFRWFLRSCFVLYLSLWCFDLLVCLEVSLLDMFDLFKMLLVMDGFMHF